MYSLRLGSGLFLFVVIIAVSLWSETVLYRNTWDAGSKRNVNLVDDETDPAAFIPKKKKHGGVKAVSFGESMSNEAGANASGNVLALYVSAGKRLSASDKEGTHFAAVTKKINSLPPGKYVLRFSFDYALDDDHLQTHYELLFYSDNGGNDSGGNDRWEIGKSTPDKTGSIDKFRHYTKEFTFTLCKPSASAPRPEGTFEVGKFSGFRLGISLDRRGDSTASEFRIDNLQFSMPKTRKTAYVK